MTAPPHRPPEGSRHTGGDSASFTTAPDGHGKPGEPACIDVAVAGNHRVVTVYGDLDLEASDLLYRHLAPTSTSDDAIVDLRDVTFLSSSAVSALLRAHLHRDRAGAPTLTIVAEDVAAMKPLRISGVAGVLDVVQTHPALPRSRHS